MTLTEFQTANDAANQSRLVLGADIGVNTATTVKSGKVIVPNGYRFVKGTLVAFTAAAQGGDNDHTTLTVVTNAAFNVNEYVRVRAASISAPYNGYWKVSGKSGTTLVTLVMHWDVDTTGTIGVLEGTFKAITSASSADSGLNTNLAMASTSDISAGDIVRIMGTGQSAYDGERIVLGLGVSPTSIRVAMVYQGSTSVTGGLVKPSAAGATPRLQIFSDRTVDYASQANFIAGREQVFENFVINDIRGTFGSEVFPEWWGLIDYYHDRAINAEIKTYLSGDEPRGNKISLAATPYQTSAPLGKWGRWGNGVGVHFLT